MRTDNRKKSSVWVGRTIAQEWERQESESERLAARKKNKTKKNVGTTVFIVVLIGMLLLVIYGLSQMTKKEEVTVTSEKFDPSVEIIDEAGIGITNRMRNYVGQVESDFKDIGYALSRAVVPAGKTREVDVYLFGVDTYFKLSIDRGTAVSAEDTVRMIRYLEERGIKAEYVDVRVEGKGFYRIISEPAENVIPAEDEEVNYWGGTGAEV